MQINKLKEKIVFLLNKGLFHIFGTSIINNIIQFLTNIFVVNLISKSEYGVYTYANNIMSFFLMVRGLGLSSGLIQFASEQTTDEKRQEIYKYVLVRGNEYNLIVTLGLVVWSCIGKFEFQNARVYLLAMLFVPAFQWLFDYVATVLRVKQNNIQYARITNINTICYFVFSLIGAKYSGVIGIVFARYFSFLISILVAGYWLKEDIVSLKKYKIKQYKEKKEITKYSFTACISNSLSELLYLLDVFLIGIFVANPDYIASYKVATQVPSALVFIPMGIITFIYPYFASHNKDMEWIRDNFYKLLKGLIALNGTICVGLYILSPYVIKILWGNEYMDALVPFRILIINFFFLGTFRIPCGNILAMLRKINVNFIISVVSSVSNIILDIILIKLWGAEGAAIATLLVVIISVTIAFPYLVIYINSGIKTQEEIHDRVDCRRKIK